MTTQARCAEVGCNDHRYDLTLHLWSDFGQKASDDVDDPACSGLSFVESNICHNLGLCLEGHMIAWDRVGALPIGLAKLLQLPGAGLDSGPIDNPGIGGNLQSDAITKRAAQPEGLENFRRRIVQDLRAYPLLMRHHGQRAVVERVIRPSRMRNLMCDIVDCEVGPCSTVARSRIVRLNRIV